ncbi:MAG: DUF2207 domain-containing protein [Candidatus Caldatribacteriota bacterium]|nr:DUF2207 domain-containing protein [Candidatus Caldatribacteriota bacterium]
MISQMYKKIPIIFFILLIVIIFSFTVLSVYAERSFKITNYDAHVKILENGDIRVREFFSYSFDGSFNGIIRSIGTRGSDGFAYFKASEYYPTEKELEVTQSEKDGMFTYHIYDKSNNENKVFLLEYQLENIATLYNDTAEFYWKFFDKTNTSPIGHVKIELEFPETVLPKDLKVFGHGPLNGKVSIEDDGKVIYEVSKLSSGEMLEARILFPTNLVPESTKIIGENKFSEIMEEEISWAKKSNREKSVNIFGFLLAPLLLLFNIFFAIRVYYKYDKELKADVDMEYYRELPGDITPAVLSKLMSIQGVGTKDILATLMDLVRKKYLKVEEIPAGRKKDYRFTILEPETVDLKKHEAQLIHWLFYSIGDGKTIALKEIKDYAKASLSQSSFRSNYLKWVKRVGEEFKKYNYFGQSKESIKVTLKTILIEFAVIILLALLGLLLGGQWYAFFPALFMVIFTGPILIVYGAILKKKTRRGINEYTKWRAFKRFLLHFSNMKDYEIPSIAVWEHYLVYAITLGVAEKVISRLKVVLRDQDISFRNSTYLYAMTDRSGNLNSGMFKSFNKSFSSAFVSTSSSSGGGGGFSSGGGGGGGGGGAGAF